MKKLTEEAKQQFRDLYREGHSIRAISAKTGSSRSTIVKFVKGVAGEGKAQRVKRMARESSPEEHGFFTRALRLQKYLEGLPDTHAAALSLLAPEETDRLTGMLKGIE